MCCMSICHGHMLEPWVLQGLQLLGCWLLMLFRRVLLRLGCGGWQSSRWVAQARCQLRVAAKVPRIRCRFVLVMWLNVLPWEGAIAMAPVKALKEVSAMAMVVVVVGAESAGERLRCLQLLVPRNGVPAEPHAATIATTSRVSCRAIRCSTVRQPKDRRWSRG